MTISNLLRAAALTACVSASLWADVTGNILGSVRDSSSAIVVGAQVVATNIDTNFTKQVVSNTEGEYRLLALPPGHYNITATAPGFQQFVESGIEVKVNDRLRVDVTLQVGTVREAVRVEANPVQVETESTQLGQVIDTKQILSLPLNGRSFIDLLGLQAGVAPTTSGSMQQDRPVSGILSSGNISVNGQRETANAFLVNGGDVSEGRNNGAGLIPNLDSIQEFRLITNSFDAEYGKFSGSVMNAITKSGTNSIHGAVFEFLRNDKFDARNFFDPTKAELRRNQFGYAVGGPFWKNKLFWFTDYQGTRQVQGAGTGLVSVPSADQRSGNFDPSAFVDAEGNTQTVKGAYWAQTLSQRLGYPVQDGEAYSTPDCTSTAGCVFPGGVIPQRAFARPVAGILPYIPLPNQASGAFADSSQKNKVVDDKMGQRVDFINDMTGNWSFYYHFDDSTVDYSLPPNGANLPGFPSTTPTRAQMAVMSNTKTFGGTQVNEFRLSFFRTSTVTDEPKG
ncbi:MAG TPA: carboxypeptidase-like regulatory domain-containing protein, partial [Bryobacteraceae bacterium]|nr:carboxypeptidase-like regulatory domain-containing protein [Bryobacteraceae bacterium]